MLSPSRLVLSLSLLIIIGHSNSNAFFQQQDLPVKPLNDSSYFYSEAGQPEKARMWLGYALAKPTPNAEEARSHFLLGDLEETEGFIDKALNAYSKSKNLAKRYSDPVIQAASLSGIASILTAMGKYDSVQFYLDESLRLDPSPTNKLRGYLVAGRSWQVQNQYDKALTHYQQAYDLAKELKNKKNTVLALTGIGSALFGHDPGMQRVRKALREALSLCDSSRYANLIARNYARMANMYMVLGKTDSAEIYLKRAKIIVDLTGNLPVRGYVLSSYATLMTEKGDISAALKYSEEPLRIKRQLKQAQQLQNDLLNVAEMHLYLKQYDKAREAILEGLATSSSLKDIMYLKYFYERFAQLDSLTGNYKNAFTHLRQSAIYRDSVLSLERIKAVEEISRKYDAEQKEKTIAEKELVIERQKYQQSIIIGASAIALLLFTIILFAILMRHRSKLQIEKQKQIRSRLQTIVHTQEEVQQSIARDIHDGLVQVMGAAKMSLQAVNIDSDKTIVHQRIKEASHIIDEACAEARTISHQLLPYSLMKDGLVSALEELFSKSFSNFKFIKSGELNSFNVEIAVNIYRISQEVVNNIVKHSEATEVNASLNASNGKITFIIEDNGRGFAPSKYQGVGLTNLQTRSELIGASIEIHSELNKGTRIQLTIPV